MTSVASQNTFGILADVEDQTQETASELSKEEVVVSKKVDRSRASKTEARIRHDYPQRGGAPRAAASTRGNDEVRSGPRDRNVGPRLSGRRNQDEGSGGSDYPPRNARGARAGERSRGGRGGRRGREYDRHSGTGREDSGKKDSQAWGDPTSSAWPSESNEPGKWGNDTGGPEESSWTANDDAANGGTWDAGNEASAPNEAGGWNDGEDGAKDDNTWNPDISLDDLSTDNVDWKSGDNKDNDDDGGYSIDAVQAPVEIVQKTLDEYLAERAQRGLSVALPEPRKPNEGADDSQWRDAVPLERDDEEDVLFAGKETSYKLKSKDKTKTKKEYIEIEQAFERPSGGSQRGRGRGRNGRDGNRERRDNRDGYREGRDNRDGYREGRDNRDGYREGRDNRDGYRENRRGRNDGVNLNDQRAFPSLGTA
ncbi:5631_t:CDS:2 [Paraglomus brasilianum]|uniref:5631_t:CDS:1 n=1 Tax=Paraglomus brasilianum TaxID=144538 RepID=A0A9N8WBW5_9GLOM|nr:5631_t:CDS:2 [Paraglomus brasilianum]